MVPNGKAPSTQYSRGAFVTRITCCVHCWPDDLMYLNMRETFSQCFSRKPL